MNEANEFLATVQCFDGEPKVVGRTPYWLRPLKRWYLGRMRQRQSRGAWAISYFTHDKLPDAAIAIFAVAFTVALLSWPELRSALNGARFAAPWVIVMFLVRPLLVATFVSLFLRICAILRYQPELQTDWMFLALLLAPCFTAAFASLGSKVPLLGVYSEYVRSFNDYTELSALTWSMLVIAIAALYFAGIILQCFRPLPESLHVELRASNLVTRGLLIGAALFSLQTWLLFSQLLDRLPYQPYSLYVVLSTFSLAQFCIGASYVRRAYCIKKSYERILDRRKSDLRIEAEFIASALGEFQEDLGGAHDALAGLQAKVRLILMEANDAQTVKDVISSVEETLDGLLDSSNGFRCEVLYNAKAVLHRRVIVRVP